MKLIEIIKTHKTYLKWKRQNVSLRGVSDRSGSGLARLGLGLYTAALGNREMAKKYGKVKFVLNAIPSNPKIVNTVNDWEIWFYYEVISKFCKKYNKDPDSRFFYEKTSMTKEMKKLGYDGVIIKGREYVHYNPKNVLYFNTEQELMDYYYNEV